MIPDDTDVLITHGPPHGVLDAAMDGFLCGCEELLDAVTTRVKPRLHIFGHIHEGYGKIVLSIYLLQKPFALKSAVYHIVLLPSYERCARSTRLSPRLPSPRYCAYRSQICREHTVCQRLHVHLRVPPHEPAHRHRPASGQVAPGSGGSLSRAGTLHHLISPHLTCAQ
jgi:hypothetical protein